MAMARGTILPRGKHNFMTIEETPGDGDMATSLDDEYDDGLYSSAAMPGTNPEADTSALLRTYYSQKRPELFQNAQMRLENNTVTDEERAGARDNQRLAGLVAGLNSAAAQVGNVGGKSLTVDNSGIESLGKSFGDEIADKDAQAKVASNDLLGQYKMLQQMQAQKVASRKATHDADFKQREYDLKVAKDQRDAVDNDPAAKLAREKELKRYEAGLKPKSDGFGEMEKTALSRSDKFRAEPQIRAYEEISSAYGKMMSSANEPGPSGDQAIITGLAKILDPTSVVRESEYATTKDGFGLRAKLETYFTELKGGGRLTPAIRSEILRTAKKLMDGQSESAVRVTKEYSDQSTKLKLDPELVVGSYGKLQAPVRENTVPAARGPAKIEDIDNMSDDELKAYLGGGA